MKKKRICVVGLGQFGLHLAVALAEECEVLALDVDQARVNEIADRVQRAHCFDSRDFTALSSVVNDEFDEAVVAVGESLEVSILSVLHLKRLRVPKIHAKAASRDHAEILRSLGADNIIFPERETALRLAAQIVNPNLLDFIPLSEDYMVMEVAPPDSFCGKSLLDLDLRKKYGVFVIAVKEHVPERTAFLPGPEFVVKPSDALLVIGPRGSLEGLARADAAT